MASGVTRTSAVREAVVSRGALAAPPTNHVRPAGAPPSGRIAGRLRGARLVAVAGQSSVVIGCHQGAGGVSAELRGRRGAANENGSWYTTATTRGRYLQNMSMVLEIQFMVEKNYP